ncbi:histidinol dehydrogenase [Metabacillus malikii]|uniref:Histidinol dehydrogenase n=1 Tax=Metabacillus malikii TaxID=1504265 RepID=A0ABT9ZM57_9BACI|nr:histidinol dehydrogenase [Metabacillus malikii]MDQ0233380.1 histidinol dehydrogenase [Metabacillus malikii]
MKITRITDEKVSLRRTIDTGTEQQRKDVQEIIGAVRQDGDQALFAYTEKFDNVSLSTLAVTEEEYTAAYRELDDELIEIIREAAINIRTFHEKQKRESWISYDDDGTMLGQKMTALDAVGVYVPGGTAAYPSSVLMNVIPAQVAGVKRIVITSPPNEKGTLPAGVLVAAKELGVAEIYKVGGAQAIAALAYGTDTIAAVDKIMGPGNIYVALAKREVFGIVDIDMIAGPSEIVVLADETARANEIAADLLSQAEHDKNSSSILVTTSQQVAEQVQAEVERQVALLPRHEIAKASVDTFGHIYVADNLEIALAVVNELAPEHLEVITENPLALLPSIKHAGAIFLGRYSSEPIGDYFAGPNHVLPTNGTARFSSPLNVDDFMKKSSIIQYSQQSFEKNFAKVAKLARLEGLEAHARALEERLK